VRGAEFISKIEALGKARKIAVNFVPRRGKGSHGTLFFGKRCAIVGSLKKELKKGTVHGMLKQLGIKSNEL
jgi:mRNA interferase HicA